MSNGPSDIDLGVRKQLVASLKGGQAFDTFDDIVNEIPADRRFLARPGGRSAWQIVEHMRFTLDDLAAYIENENGTYVEHKWPDDYWPKSLAPTEADGWESSVTACRNALTHMENLVMDESRDLLKPFEWGEGQNLLREALLAIEHTAYHLGELVEISIFFSK